MHTFIHVPVNVEWYNKMNTKSKPIQKQNKYKNNLFPIKSKSELRAQIQRKLIAHKFNNNVWLRILQTHKIANLRTTQDFKTAVKQHRQFTCSICFNIMIFPTILSCGHSFCLPCIEQASLTQNKCCLCREDIEEQYFTASQNITKLIKTIIVPSLPTQEQQQYWERYNNFVLWEHLTMISPHFKIGQTIHFFDMHANGWRYGVIVGLVFRKTDLFLKVQPLYNAEDFKEQFQFHYLSRKIAEFQFFQKAYFFKKYKQFNYDSPSRDVMLKQTVERRIKNSTITERHDLRWNETKNLDHLYSQKQINIYKYLPPHQRQYYYDYIISYNFNDFHNDTFIVYTKERIEESNTMEVEVQVDLSI